MLILFFLLSVGGIAIIAMIITFKLIHNEITRARQIDEIEARGAIERERIKDEERSQRKLRRAEAAAKLLSKQAEREEKAREKAEAIAKKKALEEANKGF